MDSLIKLAKAAAAAAVTPGRTPPAPPEFGEPLSASRSSVRPLLAQQRACFVYLTQKPGHVLRGTFGSALPRHRTLAEEVIYNATQAATVGSRRQLRQADLPSLRYTIAILEPLSRISHPSQLDPEHLGLYVISDKGKSALLMPQRPGVTSAAVQIATALREAGIASQHEATTMYRFRVEFHEGR